jgi:hypothetical protein
LVLSAEGVVFKVARDGRRREQGQHKGVKKPQPPEDHPQVVAGAAQYRVHRIAQRAFESVPIERAIRFHESDGRLDRAAPPDHRP